MASFMRGELERGESQALVRHLLTRCPQCLQMTQKLWRLGEPRRPDKYLLAEMQRRARTGRAGRAKVGEESCITEGGP